ncbi:phasin family protein [Paraburkholderia kirstenboschensis]|uniref:Phasin family protein n=1 Tax=Paraburkholderia kirstenboschensis TaxID=1245436 RepID=A0ABZ0ET62_9BURK|nr:phasin family protein [Paraburkholderia kirstenboschensis]WOD20100.1 phasin family protein [Paraburkholderia kirstenboschensis]
MSLFESDHFIASQTNNAVALFALTNTTFESFQRLTELNLQTIHSALATSEAYWHEALSVKTPEEYLTWQAGLIQPAAEQALSYSRQLYDIASNTNAELTKVAEAHYEHENHSARTLADDLVQNAPAGTDLTTTVLESALPTSPDARETVRKAAKQAIEAAKGPRTSIK